MSDAYRKINIFEVWGRAHVLAVASEVIRSTRKLEVLAEIRARQKKEIDSAAETIEKMKDPAERSQYARGLPVAFQSIIILDCLREVNRAVNELRNG